MTTRDVLEKIMRGKKSAKKAFEDFCEQEHVNGIIVLTAYRPVILLKDEFADKFVTGGSKGNGLVLTTGNMQFYKGYQEIQNSISAGLCIIRQKYGMVIRLGGELNYDENSEYFVVESISSVREAIDKKERVKLDVPSKVEIVNTVDNPVNVNITNEDEDKNIDFDEDEDYFSDEDDDD